MLQLINVSKHFGGLTALKKISLNVEEGTIVGLIGPNGAGKTTLFNAVSNVNPCDEGRILFQGKEITRCNPDQVCLKGIGRAFQLVRPFGNITVLQNVIIGGFCRVKRLEEATEEALRVLAFADLIGKKDVFARSLTIADRKRLELARALATRPRLLLLDEIMGGLNPKEIEDVIKLLRKLQKEGITLFIIEHVMQAIMALCENIVVINFGEKIADGKPDEIAKNQEVIKAYLGEEYVTARSESN
jgi:branched-chain amino acid transport system ATP-binding protein